MSEEQDPKPSAEPSTDGQEKAAAGSRLIPLWPLLMWGAPIAIATVVVVGGAYSYFGTIFNDELTAKFNVQDSALKQQRATEQSHLTHYQWVDKKAGVVRIPADRASELVLREWSARPTAPVAPASATPAASAVPAGSAAAPAGSAAPATSAGASQEAHP